MKKRSLQWGMKSFVGHLEGTGKSLHTIESYKADLVDFEKFVKESKGDPTIGLDEMTPALLESYAQYIGKERQKTNTRRRKLLTLRRLMRYLTRRNNLDTEVGHLLPAPYKVERIPETIEYVALLDAIHALPATNELELRNKVLVGMLAETGCLVSEVAKLRFDQVSEGSVEFEGKSPRKVPISDSLAAGLGKLVESSKGRKWIFQGFNKFGPLKGAISDRGVEILVKACSKRIGLGELTPRKLRHSAVIGWHQAGLGQAEIQARLGLRSDYAFRVYAPIFRRTPVSANAALNFLRRGDRVSPS